MECLSLRTFGDCAAILEAARQCNAIAAKLAAAEAAAHQAGAAAKAAIRRRPCGTARARALAPSEVGGAQE